MRNYLLWRCRQVVLSQKLRKVCTSPFRSLASQDYVRNIGIIAHVDAGKTTTTERMLYYSGWIRQLGNVDRGDTVMDFLEEERDRGITISAAGITFRWRKDGQPYFFNLIDTPGHVDFAVEVERSLFVLDGAVVILDASAGVEAQTLSVTQRAKSYKLPIVGFLNKLDKPTANVAMCVRSIQQQLCTVPLLLQVPIFDEKDRHKLVGLADLLQMELIRYDLGKDPNGNIFSRSKLAGKALKLAQEPRRQLVESVANLDDSFAELFLSIEDANSDQLSSKLASAVVSSCRQGRAMPVFVGSSLRNIGVQPLLDGIVENLPSPVSKRNEIVSIFGQEPYFSCGLIFKTVHDKAKGHLAYCRIYSGSLKRGSGLFLTNNERTTRMEKPHKFFKIMADELEEVEEADWGGIVAISGLKQAGTGMLVSTRRLEPTEIDSLSKVLPLSRLRIPPPVFSCTIEAESSSQQSTLESALQVLVREDPSVALKASDDGLSSLVISGLGELHLEIIKHRLEKEWKLKTLFGPLQIAYFEAVTQQVRRFVSEKVQVGGQTFSVAFDIEIRPRRGPKSTAVAETDNSCPDVQIMTSAKDSQIEFVKPIELKALNLGLESACKTGPILRYPVKPTFECRLYAFAITPGTSMAIVTSTFLRAVRSLLSEAGPVLLEPHMRIEVQVEKPFLSAILSDLSGRQAVIESITHPNDDEIEDNSDNNNNNNRIFVRCTAPLRLLRGYATAARVLASGRISLAMELAQYEQVGNQRDLDTIRSECGFVLPSKRLSSE